MMRLNSVKKRLFSLHEFFPIIIFRILSYLDYNRFWSRMRQYFGGTFKTSILRNLLNEDYNDWDDANGDIDWDHGKVPIPPTPSRESSSNYQLTNCTPGWTSAIDNSCDRRDSFLVTLESGLLAKVGSTHRGNDIVQGVNEETLSEKHQKQDCVGHILNQDCDCPADTCSSYNSK